jgi:hypothetical protein
VPRTVPPSEKGLKLCGCAKPLGTFQQTGQISLRSALGDQLTIGLEGR